MAVFRVPVRLTWSGPGSPGVNVFSIRAFEVSAVLDELDAALGALKAFYTALQPAMAADTVATIGPDITDRATGEDASRPVQTVTGSGGASGHGDVLQLVISWRTSLRARRGMGRTFVGPLPTTAFASTGALSGVPVNALTAAAQGLVDASTAANGWAFGVWGQESFMPKATSEARRLAPHVHRDVTGFKVQPQVAVLRSRRD
jgi:hypothetical protein